MRGGVLLRGVALLSCLGLLTACSAPELESGNSPAEITTDAYLETPEDKEPGADSTSIPNEMDGQAIGGSSEFTLAQAVAIGDKSCSASEALGVIERNEEIGITLVRVPEEVAIDGYSAASLMDGREELVFSADYFAVCSLPVEYGLMEEAGVDPDEVFTLVDSTEDSFVVLVTFEDYMYHYEASFDGEGLITEVRFLNSDRMATSGTTSVEYGTNEEAQALLEAAYASFFSTNESD